MIDLPPHLRIFVAVEPADFRNGIDGLARLARQELDRDPFSGAAFVFRNRSATAVKILVYDGRGFWLCHKRLSKGRFRFWPRSGSGAAQDLEAHQLSVLLCGGDFEAVQVQPIWREVRPGA